MFWKYRLDLRDLVSQINSMSETGELSVKLKEVKDLLAEKLEDSSVFRMSDFPQRFREEVNTPEDLSSLLDEVYEFAFDQKIWLGV